MSSHQAPGGSSRDPLAALSRAEAKLRAEARAEGGGHAIARWEARERDRAVEEKKARLWLNRVTIGAPGALLSAAVLLGYAQEHCGLVGAAWCGPLMGTFPPQLWMLGPLRWVLPVVALALVVVTIVRHRSISAQAPTSNLLEVYTLRAAEVVWAYGVETHVRGAVNATRFSVTVCLPDGYSATTTSIEKHELPDVLRSFPNAVLGYSDAPRDAYRRDPRSVR